MITIKSASELVKMQAAGKIVGETLKLLGENIRPGVTTGHLDKLAREYVHSCGATPSFMLSSILRTDVWLFASAKAFAVSAPKGVSALIRTAASDKVLVFVEHRILFHVGDRLADLAGFKTGKPGPAEIDFDVFERRAAGIRFDPARDVACSLPQNRAVGFLLLYGGGLFDASDA